MRARNGPVYNGHPIDTVKKGITMNPGTFKAGSTRALVAVALIAVAWLVGVTVAAGGGQRGGQQAGQQAGTPGSQVQTTDKPLLAEEAFKNVQVLRGISVDDFMGTMGIMCVSLAFDCSDCHDNAGTVKVDWAADTPRKRTARRMVTMVQTINKDNFGGRQVVTCWTCHRNRDRPLVTPTMDVLYGEPPEQRDDIVVQAQGLKTTATQIFDKYIQALGGAQALSQLTSYVATGTSTGFGGFGGGGSVRIYAKSPDKRSTFIQFKDDPERGDSSRTYNGSVGWVKTPLSVLLEYSLSGSELDGARLDALMGFPGQIKTTFTNTRVGFATSINNVPVEVVQGEGPRGIMTSLWFDQKTGLLVRMIRYGKSPIGRVPTQVDIADYRDVGGGVKMPFKWTFAWLDGIDTFQMTNFQRNAPVDDAMFGRPTNEVLARLK